MNITAVNGAPAIVPVDVSKVTLPSERQAAVAGAAVAGSQVNQLVESILPEGAETLHPPSAGHSTTRSHILNCPDCLKSYFNGNASTGRSKPRFNFSA